MATVVVEQRFAQPIDVGALSRKRQRGAWCAELHRVEHVTSYVSRDGLRMICVFKAPDAEAVRAVARRMGYPYERIWSVYEEAGRGGG